MVGKKGTFWGAVHVHTQLSYDGVHTLSELKSLFQDHGFHFVCLTDHSQDITQDQFETLQEQCAKLSDEEFVFILGLEYSCDGEIHIMGIGIKSMTKDTAPDSVIDHIHAHGGVAVLSHPTKSEEYVFRDVWIKKLDGAEIWNRAVDSLYLPQMKSINTFCAFRKTNPRIYAFFGLDLHRQKGYANMGLKVSGVDCSNDGIMEALRQGKFVCWSPFVRIHATSSLSATQKQIIGVIRIFLNLLRVLKWHMSPAGSRGNHPAGVTDRRIP